MREWVNKARGDSSRRTVFSNVPSTSTAKTGDVAVPSAELTFQRVANSAMGGGPHLVPAATETRSTMRHSTPSCRYSETTEQVRLLF